MLEPSEGRGRGRAISSRAFETALLVLEGPPRGRLLERHFRFLLKAPRCAARRKPEGIKGSEKAGPRRKGEKKK